MPAAQARVSAVEAVGGSSQVPNAAANASLEEGEEVVNDAHEGKIILRPVMDVTHGPLHLHRPRPQLPTPFLIGQTETWMS